MKELRLLSLYQRFERLVILILTGLIAIVPVVAVWNVVLKVVVGLVLVGQASKRRPISRFMAKMVLSGW